MTAAPTGSRARAAALLGFAGFGAFWGSWGALVPAIQSHAGASDGQLGVALLCVAAGALACMRPAGVLLDRFGPGVAALSVVALAACAPLPAVAATPLSLAAALLAVGAASGAADVAINAAASAAERDGNPLMNLAHAAFSASVVASSVLAGVLRGAGAGPVVILALVAIVLIAVAGVLARSARGAAPDPDRHSSRASLLHIPAPLLILGAFAALAYFVENAWQNWSAVHLERTLDAAPAVAALGPAVFAGAAATGRLLGHRLAARVADRVLLAAGALAGALGTLLAAVAPSVAVALTGIGIAGAGLSVCAPTLISLAGRIAAAGRRASAVSAVTTLAYLGFLAGPAVVGLLASTATLTAALAGVAAVSALLAAAARFAPTP